MFININNIDWNIKMHKSKHQYTHSMTGKPERIDYGSKYVKSKNKHIRRKTELTDNEKANFDNNPNPRSPINAFENAFANRRDGRRQPNISIERTLDFIGIGGSNQANNIFGVTGGNAHLSGLFRTMNTGNPPGNNYTSAAEAMGMQFGSSVRRTNSIFQRPTFDNRTFHTRHNSVGINNKQNNHFETEVEAKVEGLEENKVQVGRTFKN